MSTLTTEEQEKLSQFLATRKLSRGLGNSYVACSIATINLCLSNKLTARIPDCMSDVLGKWIINVQDLMPAGLRNSHRWKELLPLAAGTGKEKEKERFAIIAEWFWTTVLPCIRHAMIEIGIEDKWQEAITVRNRQSLLEIDKAILEIRKNTNDSNQLVIELHKMLWALIDFVSDSAHHQIDAMLHGNNVLTYAIKLRDKGTTIEDIWKIFAPCELLEKLVNV